MRLFDSPVPETRRLLDSVPSLINKTFLLPGRFRAALPAGIAELSRLLTSARGERSLSYLGRPNLLSAYLRYFLPWNLYRLCRLLPGLELNLKAGDVITDLGCGPLTLCAALWISRPSLRSLPLEFRCIDHSGPALEAGKEFFAALSGGVCHWKLHTIKADIDEAVQEYSAKAKPAALVCAVNVLNEMYSDLPHSNTEGLRRCARRCARIMAGFAAPSAAILAVEPGVPRSGQFISMLRSALLEFNRPPLSPCTHAAACPMPGGYASGGFAGGNRREKKRWCHFAFRTEDAPKALLRLSSAAGIPKERAVLSFLLAGPVELPDAHTAKQTPLQKMPLRVISDSFSLPYNCCGRYCCSAGGLVLLEGERSRVEETPPGALVEAEFGANLRWDAKSGALVVPISI
jgi:hypothetical protein